jgi:hypothetical protein
VEQGGKIPESVDGVRITSENVARVTRAPGGARLDLDPSTMTLLFSDSVRYYEEEATDSIR